MVAKLSQPSGVLDPAEHVLDALAAALAGRVAGMPRGPAVDRGAPPGLAGVVGVLRDVRCHAELAQVHHEVARVEMLVRAEGPARSLRQVRQHVDRGQRLSRAVGAGGPRGDDQAVPVLHQHVARVDEPGLLARPLMEQPGVGIAGGSMRPVRAPFAAKAPSQIAAAIAVVRIAVVLALVRGVATLVRLETLHRRPGLNQAAADREVLVAQQGPDPAVLQDRSQETLGDVALEQPVAVLGVDRRLPHGIVDPQANEPPEQ